MREILFRGKNENTGEWLEGEYQHFLLNDNTIHSMISVWGVFTTDVIPETVGQYTGLTDKNGKKIFEGDIVVDVACSPMYQSPRVVRFGTGTFDSGVYKYTGFVAMLPNGDTELGEMTSAYVDKYNCPNGWEVIGNIHDNPELLGGE